MDRRGQRPTLGAGQTGSASTNICIRVSIYAQNINHITC